MRGLCRVTHRNGIEEEIEVVEIVNKVFPSSGNSPYSLFWENTIAVCAIMKDERPEDVLEWMDYHRCVSPMPRPFKSLELCMVV